MGLSYAAMGRFAGPRRIREASSASRYAVYTSVADLVAMHAAARDFDPAPRQPVQGLLSARQPGKAPRGSEAGASSGLSTPPGWRQAAGRARDRERPALFVVDQRLGMFFGSRRSMKSVAAAEAAAFCAWRILDHGDPVGGVVFNDALIETAPPACNIGAAMRLIEAIAAQNAELRAHSTQTCAPAQLDSALEAASIGVQGPLQDHLVVVISDFHGHGPRTRELLIRLAARNDVLAIQVYDPFLVDMPKTGAIIVTGGELQIDLDFGDGRIRRSLYEFAEAPGKEMLAFERALGVPVLPLSAAEETAPQIRRLLERPPWRAPQS